MSEERILALEQQLSAAHEAVARLTLANTELTAKVYEAETRNRKLKRSARNDESTFRSQLAIAQGRRS